MHLSLSLLSSVKGGSSTPRPELDSFAHLASRESKPRQKSHKAHIAWSVLLPFSHPSRLVLLYLRLRGVAVRRSAKRQNEKRANSVGVGRRRAQRANLRTR